MILNLFVIVVSVIFCLYVTEVLIPTWNENALKKEEKKRLDATTKLLNDNGCEAGGYDHK